MTGIKKQRYMGASGAKTKHWQMENFALAQPPFLKLAELFFYPFKIFAVVKVPCF